MLLNSKLKNQIIEKQKTYIKNLFYQYYVPCSERQFEYFENKLNEKIIKYLNHINLDSKHSRSVAGQCTTNSCQARC
ncbi:MAG: hypothetical protein EIB84_06450 [Spiroplasma poulsonii]|nr:hypothetical protein [Spiroplasma poulsonii]